MVVACSKTETVVSLNENPCPFLCLLPTACIPQADPIFIDCLPHTAGNWRMALWCAWAAGSGAVALLPGRCVCGVVWCSARRWQCRGMAGITCAGGGGARPGFVQLAECRWSLCRVTLALYHKHVPCAARALCDCACRPHCGMVVMRGRGVRLLWVWGWPHGVCLAGACPNMYFGRTWAVVVGTRLWEAMAPRAKVLQKFRPKTPTKLLV